MSALKSFRIKMFALAAIGLACGTASAQERMRVGENYAIHIDSRGSSDVEVGRTGTARVYEISHPGATYVAIHFKRFHLAAGDFVIVSDANGGQSYVLEGKGKMNAGTFWSQHVKGDTIVLELVSTRDRPGLGFVIDEYAAGFVGFGASTERICGVNDFENAICRAPSIEYDRSQAVARLLIQGAFLCTGWLASANDHFITNEHCITTASEALNTDYEFGAEAPNCGDNNCQLCFPGTIYSGASFIQDSPGLDYALIQLAGNPSATWGFLQIDNRVAVVGEQIYLVSYPAGRAKEFAYNSSEDVGGLATVQSITEPTCSGATLEVGYWADTEGGSSGSPVLAVSSQKVIALHHCHNFCDQGGDPNRGVPIDQICAEICGFLGPECTTNADCDDSNACTNDSCVSESCVHDPIANCCGNGTCESGEDCNNCSSDCFTGSGAVCGNDVCETADGEDCQSCSADCNGVTGGRPSNRYCCGDGSAQYGVTCGDGRCTGSGNTCSSTPTIGSCCGDGTCEGSEDDINCAVDCGVVGCSVNADCDDGNACTDDVCSGGTCSNTPIDCDDGDACTTDSCSGGVCSNDPISCDDGDACTTDTCDPGSGCVNTDPPCQDDDGCCPAGCDDTNDNDCDSCAPVGGSCTVDGDCCTNKCRGPSGRKTCK